MNRDAYADFSDSPDLAAQIETTLERAEIEKDLPPLGRLLRFWEKQGRPLMLFRIKQGDSYVDVYGCNRQYFLPYMMRWRCNDD